MSVILEFDKMPQNCEKCRMLLKVSKLCAYCMATGFQIKYDETDLRDGMCPLKEKTDNSKNYVHAHWIKDNDIDYGCSACGRRQLWMNATVYEYCPHCGARMGESEENK